MKNAIILLLLFVLAFGITVLVMRWRPAGERGATLDIETESAAARETVERVYDASLDPAVSEITLTEDDLRALVLDALVSSASGSRLLGASRAVEIGLDDANLEVGLLVSTAAIGESLEGDALENLLRLVRAISGSELRLGVRGTPAVVSGELGLEREGLEILVGPLRLEAGDLENRLGIDASDLADGLRLRVGRRALTGVRRAGGALVLELESVD